MMLVCNQMGDTLTLRQADSLLLERNAELHRTRLACTEAELAARQAQLWDNPTVGGLYNVYNPVNGVWLDPGSEGEVDIVVSQPLPIGRRRRVRRAEAELQAARAGADWTAFTLRMQLWQAMCDLWANSEQASLVDRELECVDRILDAYRRSPQSVSAMELRRMETLRLALQTEQAERSSTLARSRSELALVLGIDARFEVAWRNGSCPSLSASPDSVRAGETPWHSLLAAQSAAAEAEIGLQRSLAWPQVSLTAEYDKNGSIGHNFWAVGAEVTLPLWNRNRAGVRAAEVSRDRLRVEQEHLGRQRQHELDLAATRLDQCRRMVAEAESLTSWDIEPAERQYLQRNLSLLELIDIYTAWREAEEAIVASRLAMFTAAIELNLASGTEIITIQ